MEICSMKKVALFSLLFAGVIFAANAAEPVQRRSQQTTDGASTAVTSARAARTPVSASVTAARSATRSTAARSATTTPSAPIVSARAAATQKVIGSGTKVGAATTNTVINEACRAKYEGCMDSFCMVENASGGRCTCSNQKKDLDAILSQIEELDQQSYRIATEGVEKLEMGTDADAIIAAANAAAKSVTADREKNKARRSLDLSLWAPADFEVEEDIFAVSEVNSLEGKTGDNLHSAVSNLCRSQMPECSNDFTMMQMIYANTIKSDCTAYENELKRQKTLSQQKLYAAEKALREAALDSYRTMNKYDLGQCTVAFKNCMATTAGCKDDFTGCVGIAAAQNAQTKVGLGNTAKMVDIKGSVTKISIAASSMDALLSKQPMCMNVTNSCVAVKDEVWKTFLREVAPQIKTAELAAESDLRTNCIANISSCFQKACRDTMDPKDEEGSYNLCLTRPEAMRSLCKVQIDPCEAAAPMVTTADGKKESVLWGFVKAKLAAMRIGSCTEDVKKCLQSKDRCGSDYTQCIGLDTDTIIRMCPADLLVGCQKVETGTNIVGDAVYSELATMVEGIMLNIDNNMMKVCQSALDESMVKVCGDTENCDSLVVNNGGQHLKYEICEFTIGEDKTSIIPGGTCYPNADALSGDLKDRNLAGFIKNTLYWGEISYDMDINKFTDWSEYSSSAEISGTDKNYKEAKQGFDLEMKQLSDSVTAAINMIEADPVVQFCMTGREVQGMRNSDGAMRLLGGIGETSVVRGDGKVSTASIARFPNLTKQVRGIIANSAITNARKNYMEKYSQLNNEMAEDRVKVATKIDKTIAADIAAQTCEALADSSTLPISKAPKKSNFGKWLAVGIIAVVGVVASVFTFGGAGVAAASAIGAITGAMSATTAGVLVATAAGIATASVAASGSPVGQSNAASWNYKETVTTTFNRETGVCQKVRVYQNCAKVKKNYCKNWAEPVEVKEDIPLL